MGINRKRRRYNAVYHGGWWCDRIYIQRRRYNGYQLQRRRYYCYVNDRQHTANMANRGQFWYTRGYVIGIIWSRQAFT